MGYIPLATHNAEALAAVGDAHCVHCCKTYPVGDLEEWTDDGTTAICPHCSVDAVIPCTGANRASLQWWQECANWRRDGFG